MKTEPVLIVRGGNASSVLVSSSQLCEVAANTFGNSFALEHALVQESPYPWPKIKRIQALQKLCQTILRLAKHRPRNRIEVPLAIWRDLTSGNPCSLE